MSLFPPVDPTISPITRLILIASAVLATIVVAAIASLMIGTILWYLWPITAVGVFGAPPMTWHQIVAGWFTATLLLSLIKGH